MKLGTSNCAGYSTRNPKHSARYVYHTGTSASSGARADTSCDNGTEEKKKFVQYTMDLLSIPNYYIKKGRPRGHRYGKKPGDREYFISNSLKKKCKKKFFSGIHDQFIRDEKFRKNMFDVGRTEELCREMDKLANEDHTDHITPEEISVYRNNWWICSNTVGSDTMPVRHRPDFKQALSTFRQLRDQEDTAHQHWTGRTSLLVLLSRRGREGKHTVDDCAMYRNDWNGLQRHEQRILVWIGGAQDEDPWE